MPQATAASSSTARSAASTRCRAPNTSRWATAATDALASPHGDPARRRPRTRRRVAALSPRPASARTPLLAVAVPARDEAGTLPRLFAALAAQRDCPAFSLCLYLDGCTDDSEAIVASMAPGMPFAVVVERSHVRAAPSAGLARGRAMALAAERSLSGILLTTDADSEPAPDWIAANLAALAHADLVAGRIVRDDQPASAVQDRIGLYSDRLHALRRAIDPVPWEAVRSHHWTSGASLACHAGVYRDLGGIPAVPSGEDAAFADAAARAGYRLRRDADVVVRTSGRRRGRADGGMAARLAMLDASPDLPTLTHPGDEAWRFHMQARARAAHAAGSAAALAPALRLAGAEVAQVAAECRNGEAFAARIVGTPPGGMRQVPLPQAEALLDAALEADGHHPDLAGAA